MQFGNMQFGNDLVMQFGNAVYIQGLVMQFGNDVGTSFLFAFTNFGEYSLIRAVINGL